MKKKKIFFYITILITLFIIIFGFASSIYAASEIYKQPKRQTSESSSEQSLEDMISDADSFVEKGTIKYDQTALQNFSKTFYNIMLTIGIFAAVIVGAIIGIQLMISGVEEKAEYKKKLVIYLIGCVVVFGGFTIWKLIVNILESI